MPIPLIPNQAQRHLSPALRRPPQPLGWTAGRTPTLRQALARPQDVTEEPDRLRQRQAPQPCSSSCATRSLSCATRARGCGTTSTPSCVAKGGHRGGGASESDEEYEKESSVSSGSDVSADTQYLPITRDNLYWAAKHGLADEVNPKPGRTRSSAGAVAALHVAPTPSPTPYRTWSRSARSCGRSRPT